MGNVIWRYYPNPYRKFCDRWWYHWVDIRALCWDISDFFHRGINCWAYGDTWDLMSYHAGVTLGLLEHFKKVHHGYIGETPEDYEAKLDIAIDAWRAKLALLDDDGWDPDKQDYLEFRAPLEERWEKGYPVFIEIYDSLWD